MAMIVSKNNVCADGSAEWAFAWKLRQRFDVGGDLVGKATIIAGVGDWTTAGTAAVDGNYYRIQAVTPNPTTGLYTDCLVGVHKSYGNVGGYADVRGLCMAASPDKTKWNAGTSMYDSPQTGGLVCNGMVLHPTFHAWADDSAPYGFRLLVMADNGAGNFDNSQAFGFYLGDLQVHDTVSQAWCLMPTMQPILTSNSYGFLVAGTNMKVLNAAMNDCDNAMLARWTTIDDMTTMMRSNKDKRILGMPLLQVMDRVTSDVAGTWLIGTRMRNSLTASGVLTVVNGGTKAACCGALLPW